MVLAPLLAAPTLMLAATAAERRFGAAVAGAIAAAPVVLSVIVLAVGTELGRDAGATLAAGAAAHVTAQIAFALAFATTLTRRGGGIRPARGHHSLRARLAARRVHPAARGDRVRPPGPPPRPDISKGVRPLRKRLGEKPRSGRNRSDPLVGAVASFVMVGAALGTAELVGPAAAGTIGAFPALSAALALVLARTRGAGAAAAALGGLIGGLRAYLVFCLTVAVAAPALGVLIAVPLALGLCAAVYSILLTPSTTGPWLGRSR